MVLNSVAFETVPIPSRDIVLSAADEVGIDFSRGKVLGTVVFALFTDMFIYESLIPILPKVAANLNASQTAFGFMFSAFAVVVLISTPLIGVIVDRCGRRGTLLAGAAALAAATTVMANADSFEILFFARMMQGISGAAIWTSGMALVADLYPREQRGWAMGIVMTGISMGTLVGPLLGGVLYERLGTRAPFYAGAILAWLGLALLWKTVPHRPGYPMQGVLLSGAAPRMWHVGLLSLWKRAEFRRIFIIVFLGGMMLCLLEPTLPLHLDQTFSAGPESIGLLFLAATAAYGLFSPLAGMVADRWNRRIVMSMGLVSAAAVLPWIVVSTTWTSLIAVMILFGVSCAMLLTPALPEMADAAEDGVSSDYGAGYAWFNMAYATGMMIGTGVGGWIASHNGLLTAFCTASFVAVACLPLLRVRQPGSNGCRNHV